MLDLECFVKARKSYFDSALKHYDERKNNLKPVVKIVELDLGYMVYLYKSDNFVPTSTFAFSTLDEAMDCAKNLLKS